MAGGNYNLLLLYAQHLPILASFFFFRFVLESKLPGTSINQFDPLPGRDGKIKILCDHRQDGNDEVHRL